jgi:hypothetical protein
MRVHQRVRLGDAWTLHGQDTAATQLALVFSSTVLLTQQATWDQLRAFYPTARIVACSTAGEIVDTNVHDDSITCTGIAFDHSSIAVSSVRLGEASGDAELGALLVSRLPQEGLVHLLVLSDGLKVNGSALVKGIVGKLPVGVAVTGGLSGDGPRFQRTAVCLDGAEPSEQVVAIGLYGPRLRIGFGSMGGWDPFGPERRITKSAGNVLFELDGEPALDLYKRYLGEHATSLPSSGLLFPLAIHSDSSEDLPVVRTILAVDEQARTLTFAGDVPMGYRARLMRSNFERLVDGASGAAKVLHPAAVADAPDLAILISCVGRKLVLKQRVEEEVEAVREVLGASTTLAGFYSYGEISPFAATGRCELHNQTMTITTISER